MKNVDIISKVVARKGEEMASPSKEAASVNLSGYLLKDIWDKCWEIKTTEKGEEYLFGKLPVGLQFDLTSFVDGGSIDLPDIYDGLPIDNQTLYWEEVTDEQGNTSRVLKSMGSGNWDNIEGKPSWIGSSKPDYSWSEITGKPSWIGSSKPTYSYSEITGKPDLSDMATKTWVGNNYLPTTGGTLSGNLRLKDSSNYGRYLYFGDGSYCYIHEDTDDHMVIYGSNGIIFKASASKFIDVEASGIRVNGGVLTYNSSGGYWELKGNVLVTGDVTSYS